MSGGLDTFTHVKNGRRYNRTTAEIRDKMVEDYLSGMTLQAVAAKYGVWDNAVYGNLRRRGIKCRPNRRGYRGGKSMKEGYVMTLVTDGGPLAEAMAGARRYIPEHRLVMAEHFGRPLKPSESVHHVNGDKTDNRLENLQLRQGKHGKGICYTCRDCGSHNVEAREL